MHYLQEKRINNDEQFIYRKLKVLKLDKEEPLYPKICICLTGETDKNNYQNILKSLLALKMFTKGDKDKLGFSFIDPRKLSLNAYKEKKVDKKRKIEHELRIWLSDAKENYEKSMEYLKKIKKGLTDEEKIKVINLILELHKDKFNKDIAKKGICKFHCIVRLSIYKKLSNSSIENGDFIDEFKEANDLISIFSKYKVKTKGYTCNHFAFESKKYELFGNIKFPADILSNLPSIKKIPFVKTLINQMGKPKVEGVAIGFENSPLGLEKISIEYEDNQYIIPLKFNFKTEKLEKLIKRNYLHSVNITKLFMRKIK